MNKDINQILGHILSGDASTKDYILFSQWMNEDSKNQALFQQIKGYWDAELKFSTTISPSVTLNNIRHKISHKRRVVRLRLFTKLSISAAAAVALILITVTHLSPNVHPAAKEEIFTYVTNQNRSEFSLSDGSKVMLNKNSRLTYSEDYGKNTRKVQLKGEAYFEVEKDTIHPFIVDMGDGASIRVLGTKFSANNVSKENLVETVLLEGSIQFEHQNEHTILSPNQRLIWSKVGNKISIIPVNAEEQLAWKDGLQKYRSIALSDLIEQLQQRYGVPIHITARSLLNPDITVTGTFQDNQSLPEVLNIISKSLPIHWSLRNMEYYVEPN